MPRRSVHTDALQPLVVFTTESMSAVCCNGCPRHAITHREPAGAYCSGRGPPIVDHHDKIIQSTSALVYVTNHASRRSEGHQRSESAINCHNFRAKILCTAQSNASLSLPSQSSLHYGRESDDRLSAELRVYHSSTSLAHCQTTR